MQSFFGSKRLIRVARKDFVNMLMHSDPAHPLGIEELDEETQEKLKNFGEKWLKKISLQFSFKLSLNLL